MIKILDKNIADKIAAGEVVERPLSIVKELTENAVDAGAKNIAVEIKNGGKSYIRVTDDGCGIQADECELAFMRHATSKITDAKDLDHIDTLGFRGEALASIAAVSRTELLTKTKDAKAGRKVLIYGGEIVENSPCGSPDGTTIVVRDLFYNTPARLKFMKSDSSESSAVIEFITNMALAYPNIRVRMINNGRILFATNGKGNRGETIGTLTSNILKERLIPFTYEENDISLEGYVSGPGESRSSRKNQVFFINGRSVDSKVIEKGISAAYSDRLFERRFPICYLFLHVPPEKMDVNIHPNKKQVRFYDESVITDIVKRGIISALDSKEAIPEIKTSNKTSVSKNTETKKEKNIEEPVDINYLLTNYENKVAEKEENQRYIAMSNVAATNIDVTNELEKEPERSPETPVTFDFTSLRIHGQFFGTYIQLSDEDAIYFLDQHAAHERVFFEKFRTQFYEREKHRQPLLLPFSMDVSYADRENEESWLPILENTGFALEEFGPLSYKVFEIPLFMDMKEAENFISDFASSIGEYRDFTDKNTIDKIATRACKAAVKANDHLSDTEIVQLLSELSRCENPFSCPHGRPTFIKITKSDMEKRFKRT